MKKTLIRFVALMLFVMVLCSCAAAPSSQPAGAEGDSGAEAPQESYKIGMLYDNLDNVIFVDTVNYAKEYGPEKYNCEITAETFDKDPSIFITKMENFITAGYDGIAFLPTTAEGTNEVLQQAKDAGIALLANTTPVEIYDVEYMVEDEAVGYACGEMAIDWINSHESLKNKDEVKIAIMNGSAYESCLNRVKGMRRAMEELGTNATVVMDQDAMTTEEFIGFTEDALTAHPDLDMILCIADVQALGANESVTAAKSEFDEDFAIFSIDGSIPGVKAMADGTYIRGTVNLGTGAQLATTMIDALMNVIQGREQEKHMTLPINPISYQNLEEMIGELNYTSEIPEINTDVVK